MRHFTKLFLVLATFSLTACGLGEAGPLPSDDTHPSTSVDGGTPPSGNPGTTTGTTTAPFRSSAKLLLEVSPAFTDGSACVEIVGNLPGITWQTGIVTSSTLTDGFLSASCSMSAGTYDFSYRAVTCTGHVQGKWADYGDKAKLNGLTSDARRWIACNWYDSANRRCVSVSNPGCNLRATVDGQGNLTPAGNMGSFASSDTNCQ